MKKILFLVPRYAPAVGGVEKHTAHLAQELIHRGFSITVLTTSHQPGLKPSEIIAGVKVIRLPFQHFNHKLQTWQWIWQHRQLFVDADIVHIHDVFWWYYPLRIYYFNKKVFTTFHGYEGPGLPRWQAVWHRRLVEKLSYRTIAVGEFIKKWYGQNPDLIIYGAADQQGVSDKTTAKKNSAVFLGRLEEDTGIMMYLEALQRIQPKINLDVYGEGSFLNRAKKFVQRRKLDVKFYLWQTRVDQLYNSHEYAFVSRYLAILEAMQSKRLVLVVYNNQIKKDYLTMHPASKWMVIAGSAQELAEKLQKLSEAQKNNMIKQAYDWAEQQTWPKLADEYLKLWGVNN